MSSSFYRLSNDTSNPSERKCKTPTERVKPLHLNSIKRQVEGPPTGSNISTKGNSSYLIIAPEQELVSSGRPGLRLDTQQSDCLSLRSPSAQPYSSRSYRLSNPARAITPTYHGKMYRSQAHERLSPVYARPNFNSTYQITDHRPSLNSSLLEERRSPSATRQLYRTSRQEFRERLSHSSSFLSRSGGQSSLNRSQIQEVETRLKDMNKKILEAMAESRKTVVRLLTEPVDQDPSMSFEAKLKEVQDQRKLDTPLIETKSKLLNIKDIMESSGSRGNPLSSRQASTRQIMSAHKDSNQQEEPRTQIPMPQQLTQSVNQIEPKMTSQHLGSQGLIINSLGSQLSDGQHTSNFTGLLKEMHETETDQVLLGSKALSSNPEFLSSIPRIESSSYLTKQEASEQFSKKFPRSAELPQQQEEVVLSKNEEIISKSQPQKMDGIQDMLRRESGAHHPQAATQAYFKTYLKKGKSTPKGSLTFGQKSSMGSVKRQLKYTTNSSQDECTFGHSGSNLFQHEPLHFHQNASINRSTPESAELGARKKLRTIQSSPLRESQYSTVGQRLFIEELKNQEKPNARESNFTVNRQGYEVMAEDCHGSAATLTKGGYKSSKQKIFGLSENSCDHQGSFFQSRRYQGSAQEEVPSPIIEQNTEEKETSEFIDIGGEEDWVNQSSPNVPRKEPTNKPSLDKLLVIPDTRQSRILQKEITESGEGLQEESSFNPPSKSNLYLTGESSFADDERSNLQQSYEEGEQKDPFYARNYGRDPYSGEIVLNGDSPALSRISEEDSPLGHTNKFSRQSGGGIGILAEKRSSGDGRFHIDLQVAQRSIDYMQGVEEIKEEDALTEQSEQLDRELPREQFQAQQMVRVLSGNGNKNLVSNDSMFRSVTPTTFHHHQHTRGPEPLGHSKTNSWLNETISAVQAEADVAAHEPGEERRSVNLVQGKLENEARISDFHERRLQPPPFRLSSQSTSTRYHGTPSKKSRKSGGRVQDTSSFVYLKVDSSVVSEFHKADASFIADPQTRLPQCFERNYERAESNCKDSFLIHGGNDCQKIDCNDASILASTTPTAYSKRFVMYNQDSAKNDRYSNRKQKKVEIEYEEEQESNSCIDSEHSGRPSMRARTPLCIYVPSRSELIQADRIGEIIDAPNTRLAIFRSKKNDIPAYITDKTIFYAISSRCPNTARVPAQPDISKLSNTGAEDVQSSGVLEYSQSPPEQGSSLIQDSVLIENSRKTTGIKKNSSRQHMSSSEGNNTTIRAFNSHIASIEERPSGQNPIEDEDDKQLAEVFGLNLTEPRNLLSQMTIKSNEGTPSKAVRPPRSLESKPSLNIEKTMVSGELSKTPKAFSLPLATPENRMTPVGSQAVTPSRSSVISPAKDKKRGSFLGSEPSPSTNMMKLKLAQINEESEDNRVSSSRREDRLSLGGAIYMNNLGDNLRRFSREEVAAQIRNWLSTMNLESLTGLFVEAGFDDLNALLLQAKSRMPITRDLLHRIGVKKPGHQSRILVKLEQDNIQMATSANVTPRDPNSSSQMRPLKINIQEKGQRAGILCCGPNTSGLSVSIGVQNSSTENSFKRQEEPKLKIDKKQIPQLGDWLDRLRLRSQVDLFKISGYDELEWLFIQMQSSIPITDEILEHEVGISKIGYRSRILFRLSEDAARFEVSHDPRRQSFESGALRAIHLETSSEKASEGACRCAIF